jgi:hypothetical protein
MITETHRKQALARVQQMTDRQLSTRYGKMSDKKKIEAFYSVLKDEKRNDVLQQRIAQDYPEFASVDIADVANEWVVFRENEEHGFNHEYITFTQPAAFGNGVTPYLLVSEPSPMRIPNESVQHSTESARELWDSLMKDGWRIESK